MYLTSLKCCIGSLSTFVSCVSSSLCIMDWFTGCLRPGRAPAGCGPAAAGGTDETPAAAQQTLSGSSTSAEGSGLGSCCRSDRSLCFPTTRSLEPAAGRPGSTWTETSGITLSALLAILTTCILWPCPPIEVLKGDGELQAGQEEHWLQKLLQPLQSLHAAEHCAAGLDHLVNVLSETLAHLHTDVTIVTTSV